MQSQFISIKPNQNLTQLTDICMKLAENKIDNLEEAFKIILQSCKRPIDAEVFRQNFSEINKRAYAIANQRVYKIYSTATTSNLDFEIGKYFINPTWSDLTFEEIKFLLTHPLATPDLYIFKENNPHIETHQKRCFIIRRSLLNNHENLLKAFKNILKNSLCIAPEIFKYQMQDIETFTHFKMRSAIIDVFHRQDYFLLNIISRYNLKLDFLKSDDIAITNLETNPSFYENTSSVFTSDFIAPLIKITEYDDIKLFDFLIKSQPDLEIFKNQLSILRFDIDGDEFSFSEFTVQQRAYKVIERLIELKFDMGNKDFRNDNLTLKQHSFFAKSEWDKNAKQVRSESRNDKTWILQT